MGQLTGRVFISLGGKRVRSKDGASLDIGGPVREAARSDSGVDGHTVSETEPKVTFKINHSAQTSLKELQDFEGTLIFETDTGRIYTLMEAF